MDQYDMQRTIGIMDDVLREVAPQQNQTTNIIYYGKKPDYSKKNGRLLALKYILYIIPLLFCFFVYCFPELNDWESRKIFIITINGKQVDLRLIVMLLGIFVSIFLGMKIYIKFIEKPKEEMINKSESYIKVFDDRLELKYMPGAMKVNVFSNDQQYSDLMVYYNDIQSIHIKGPDSIKSLGLFLNIGLRGTERYRKCYRDIYIVKSNGERIKFPELMLRDFFELELKKRKINIIHDN